VPVPTLAGEDDLRGDERHVLGAAAASLLRLRVVGARQRVRRIQREEPLALRVRQV